MHRSFFAPLTLVDVREKALEEQRREGDDGDAKVAPRLPVPKHQLAGWKRKEEGTYCMRRGSRKCQNRRTVSPQDLSPLPALSAATSLLYANKTLAVLSSGLKSGTLSIPTAPVPAFGNAAAYMNESRNENVAREKREAFISGALGRAPGASGSDLFLEEREANLEGRGAKSSMRTRRNEVVQMADSRRRVGGVREGEGAKKERREVRRSKKAMRAYMRYQGMMWASRNE